MVNTDVLYYESMIDLVIEDRKINEEIMSPKFMKYFTENQQDIIVYENKITESIIGFIKKILDKVIEFFKKIINLISDKRNLSPDKKLISEAENIIKGMTKEDKDKFSVKIKMNMVGDDLYLDYLIDRAENGISYLEQIMYDIKDLMYKDTKPENLELDNFDTSLENPTVNELEIKYNGLKEVISQYENTYTRVKRIRSQMQTDQNSMNAYKKDIDSAIRKNSNSDNNDILNKYKNITMDVCNLIMKANSETIKDMRYSFSVYEGILKKLTTSKEYKPLDAHIASFNLNAFNTAVSEKDFSRIKTSIISVLRNGDFENIPIIIDHLKKYTPEIFEDFEIVPNEIEKKNINEWDREYFIRQTFYIGENFNEKRINYCIKIYKYLNKK